MENSLQNVLRDLNDIAVLQIVFIIIGAITVYWLVQKTLPRIADKLSGRWRLYLLATVPVVRLIVVAAALSMIISRIIQPTVQNLFAILGALGLALGFAFKDYVSSLIAGVVLLYEMPFRPGDWVEIEGTYGEVKTIGIRAVEIVTPDDSIVSIPHLKLWDHLVSNANDGSTFLMCVTDFYLSSDHDSQQVKQLLKDVALTSCFLQLERPVTVIVSEEPWGTHYKVKAYPVDPRDQFQFKTDITIRGKEALQQLGISFVNLPVLEAFKTGS
ncbi:MAG: mechanosensitive ion channel [Balneolaceae bacterium]|nr:mechanosensitive ion channel [Balneolaceae bacterium]